MCQEAASAKVLDEMLAYVGWTASSATSVAAAEAWLRVHGPAFMVVTGEYDLDTVSALRKLQPVSIVWLTRGGQHRPTLRAEGVYEVTEFSHEAIFGCIAELTGGVPPTEAPPASAADEERAADPSLQGLRVLVAEDNPLNQTLITEQLTALGCEPIFAGDGREALLLLKQAKVDLVLTDIHMPIMDGYALMEALRQSHRHLPVLAFSAVVGAEQIDEWRRRGFAAYVPKPASSKQVEVALLALGLRGRREGEAGHDGEKADAAGFTPGSMPYPDAANDEHTFSGKPADASASQAAPGNLSEPDLAQGEPLQQLPTRHPPSILPTKSASCRCSGPICRRICRGSHRSSKARMCLRCANGRTARRAAFSSRRKRRRPHNAANSSTCATGSRNGRRPIPSMPPRYTTTCATRFRST
jgi:CheY-like chemotaxis protein